MRGGIFQIRRDAYPAGAVGDNVAEGLGYAAGGDWEPAASAPDANDLGDAHVDVSQIAENLRISRPSAYRLIEGEQIPAIRIGRLQACSEGRSRREAAPHEQRRLVKARHELAALGSGQAPDGRPIESDAVSTLMAWYRFEFARGRFRAWIG